MKLNRSASRLDQVFHALSDSTRRSILRDVSRKEKSVSELAEPFNISLAAVSKHLRVLEAARLVRRRRCGNFQMIQLNHRPMMEATQWLAYYENFWNRQLDALETMLEGDVDC
jgi:DNA-binding transcriptional ArsR family regulator